MSSDAKPPIIFIGMHRSGTSLLGELLEQLGLFSGSKKDEHNEALFFLELNNWLMGQAGARWDNPEQVRYLWCPESEAVLQASREYIQHLMTSPRAIRFLGVKSYLCNRSIARQSQPWGWKDPRNTFTLPFWLSLFPDSRIVFIERHGVDVAESLRVRAIKTVETTKKTCEKYKPILWTKLKRGGFSDSPRCLLLEEGFSLWRSYQEEATRQLADLPDDRLFRLRYEDLLTSPQQQLERASKFCGLDTVEQEILKITQGINPKRAFSYRNSEELTQFAEMHQADLAEFGY